MRTAAPPPRGHATPVRAAALTRSGSGGGILDAVAIAHATSADISRKAGKKNRIVYAATMRPVGVRLFPQARCICRDVVGGDVRTSARSLGRSSSCCKIILILKKGIRVLLYS